MNLIKIQGDESRGLLRRSRMVKTVADSGIVKSFSEGEARLKTAVIRIVISNDAASTPAGMAAVLTAARICLKTFQRVVVEGALDQPFTLPILGSHNKTLRAALLMIGVCQDCSAGSVTHEILIGADVTDAPIAVRCWWDGWHTGIRPLHDDRVLGDSKNPLAGVFAGALAVREIFAQHMLQISRATHRTSVLSLWEPWVQNGDLQGPDFVSLPNKLWLVGLGHLGQGIAWNLLTLPMNSERHIILQDDQTIGVENEPTGLLVREIDIHGKKCRSVAHWFEAAGWITSLIERRHHGETSMANDPPLVLSALDSPESRRLIASASFPYMVDIGVGHGPRDFETIQAHCIAKDEDISGLWTHAGMADRSNLMSTSAYQEDDERVGGCGMEDIAGAGVAVPFVGAAAGAIAVAQSIRILSLGDTFKSFQLQMACPDMPTTSDIRPSAKTGYGGERVQLGAKAKA